MKNAFIFRDFPATQHLLLYDERIIKKKLLVVAKLTREVMRKFSLSNANCVSIQNGLEMALWAS